MGTDPRDRRFDMKKQAQDYDPKGNYQSKWLEKTLFLEQKILKTLTQRSSESSICPSEILESKNKKNKVKMEEVRSAARRLHNQGMIHICQKGIKVNPLNVRGPIRLKLSRNPS